jgi:hypothetical protein
MDPRNIFRKMMSSTARRTNQIAMTPVLTPIWTKVLRLGYPSVSKMTINELIEVMKVRCGSLKPFLNQLKQ